MKCLTFVRYLEVKRNDLSIAFCSANKEKNLDSLTRHCKKDKHCFAETSKQFTFPSMIYFL